MKERPILFSGQMVRAIIEGRKNQTRRVVKGKLIEAFDFLAGTKEEPCCGAPRIDFVENQKRIDDDHREYEYTGLLAACDEYPEEGFLEIDCPYGNPGDRLWVRETWAKNEVLPLRDRTPAEFIYRAELNDIGVTKYSARWKPSIHMPRKACRLILEITNVRVERLNDITEEDAKSEGIDLNPAAFNIGHEPLGKYLFHGLWESINGAGSWEKNPWVWVVEFKKVAS